MPWLGSKGQNLIRGRSAEKGSIKSQPLRKQIVEQWWTQEKLEGCRTRVDRSFMGQTKEKGIKGKSGKSGSAKRFSEVYLNLHMEAKSSMKGRGRLCCSQSPPHI